MLRKVIEEIILLARAVLGKMLIKQLHLCRFIQARQDPYQLGKMVEIQGMWAEILDLGILLLQSGYYGRNEIGFAGT